MRYLMMMILAMIVASCSSTYQVKQESSGNNEMLEEVPKWFVMKPTSDNFLYGAGVATSPDLNLAIKKANLIAKAEIADVINGEMNERATYFSTEVGRDKNKRTVQEFDRTIVNVISKTAVTGYEVAEQDIYTTAYDEYRVYLLLKFSYDVNATKNIIFYPIKNKYLNQSLVSTILQTIGMSKNYPNTINLLNFYICRDKIISLHLNY